MTEPRQRPDYIYSGGNVLMHPPLRLGSSRMYGFFLKGDRQQLQQTVDITLNAPAAGHMRFKVLSPYVMLTFTQVQHANSTNPVDEAKGWGEETDIVTWVLVGQLLPGQSRVNRLFVYPVHIWVDDTMALINGRELFGYPKYSCEYTMPAPGEPALRFTLAAKGFQPYSPQTQLAMHPLLDVHGQGNTAHTPLADIGSLVKQLVQVLASDADALDLDAAGWEQVIETFTAPQLDQIFLKQFPDAAGEKAVYQAVVSAPATVTALRSVQLLGPAYQATLHPYDSFPLNRTLGLPLGTQPALLGFHLDMDFEVPPGTELVDNSQVRPQKVAVLGGGVGAMTAAFHLTEQPGWRNRYEITVYQMGWRLGGKGASGRNAEDGQRIEEHGLHIWFGFYDNAFAMMQKAYGALDRPPGAPLATWQDAFKPQHFIALTEWIDGQWKTWPIDTPIKPGEPGHGNESLGLWAMATTAYAWVRMWFDQLRGALDEAALPAPPMSSGEHPDWLHRLAAAVETDVEHLAADAQHVAEALHALALSLPEDLGQHGGGDRDLMNATLRGLRAWLWDAVLHRLDGNDTLRRLYICIDLAVTSLIGMIEDGVLVHGFDVINDIDFYDWLTKHGANPRYTVHSAPVRGFYDLVFAYEDGDFDRPNIEAGTMLRGMMKVAIAYHGGMMWKMQAGMGDTVFTPLYQLLKARGVTFKFFHKVEELLPAADGSMTVDTIRLTRQVDVTRGADHYDPLVDVEGLACWPSTPNYGQIVPEQAALLQRGRVNLESNWSDWPQRYEQHFGRPLPQLTLKRGEDFDLVVFGISVDGVPQLCSRLVERSPALQTMTRTLKTVATQAYQVWLNQDLRQIGWASYASDGQPPVLSGYSEPFDTWAPMDQLLVRESWPPALQPKNVSYFCSALPMAHYPPPSDHAFPERCSAAVKHNAIDQLTRRIHTLWPSIATAGSFEWPVLVDAQSRTGEQRFDAQYWRANIDPSERYVLSVVDSTAARLPADGSGYANLYLAGDWLRTGLNAGCVEGAVMGGMQASRAISGWPLVIRGEKDL
ncbi:NAD(P)-binding protein [Schlegelella sp. S2-27]|uniref:NAD(P)-binding protein n=1 Tax=Caldimonas mangrovi TaxID=2944811 RepID=A0ABT0YKC7_9BURK|nr:NAD(P)-binding protein [Caldimonas mangrovi]MCM5679182.1 NAD(P)-binding protein [Caldimonas mangrovi]